MSDRTSIETDACEAYEAIRRINHATIFVGDGIPAPVVYQTLSFLQSAGGYGLAQALGQLTRGLERSLTTYEVYEDDDRDPALSVARAVTAIEDAVALLEQVGPLLDDAQAAIARQGYRTPASAASEWRLPQ